MKKFLGICLAGILSILLLVQIVRVKSASAEDPISGPITSPITGPLVSPTDTPTMTPTPTETLTPTPTETLTPTPTMSSTPTPTTGTNTITGKVTERDIDFFKGVQKPVADTDVTITATNIFTPTLKYSTMTDNNGNYSLPVTPGFYQIEATDTDSGIFIPLLHVVNIKNNNKKANFQALEFGTGSF